MSIPTITPYLWFDSNAEEAIALYTRVFPDARVIDEARVPAGVPGLPAGALMNATFEVAGQRFIALNGGPQFRFTEAVSFFVTVETQEEVDYYWDALTADGGEAGQCGWLKDPFGLSWQIAPQKLMDYLTGSDPATAQRVMQAMLQMRKIDIAELDAAAASAD